MKKYKYLIYVDYSISGLKVFGSNCDDVFHTMGEIMFRSLEKIERITFNEYTLKRENYWKNESFSIYEFKNKYKRS